MLYSKDMLVATICYYHHALIAHMSRECVTGAVLESLHACTWLAVGWALQQYARAKHSALNAMNNVCMHRGPHTHDKQCTPLLWLLLLAGDKQGSPHYVHLYETPYG